MNTCRLFAAFFAIAATAAHAAGLGPWQFNMSRDEVQAVVEYAPYKVFKNGDLETYEYTFEGKKENIQFFFDDKGLRRIGVYRYEGYDAALAASSWLRTYEFMQREYGEVRNPVPFTDPKPDPKLEAEGKPQPTREMVWSITSALTAVSQGKVQLAPVKGPADMHVFASLIGRRVQNRALFASILYFDRP